MTPLPKKLHVGIIGEGAWAKRLVATLLGQTAHCDFSWCTKDPVVARENMQRRAADFVVIATPYTTHARYMGECFERKIPFIVEKPCASLTQLQALSLQHYPSPTTPTFLANHTLLFNPAVEMMVNFAKRYKGDVPVELRGEHGGPGPVREDCSGLTDYGSHGIALGLWLGDGARPVLLDLDVGDENTRVDDANRSRHGAQNYVLTFAVGALRVTLRTGNNYPRKRLLYTTRYEHGLTHRFREFPERELLAYIGPDLLEMEFDRDTPPLANALDTFAQVVKGEREADDRFGWTLPLHVARLLAECGPLFA